MQNYTEPFQQYWAQFSSQLKLDSQQTSILFNLLFNAYTESQRYYHTIQHIVECLDMFHQVRDQLNDPIAVEWAIWFHDIVYDPQASDNEEQSADLMQKKCGHLLSSDQIKKVYAWILATKKHKPSNDQDLNYLLDIDLAILGSLRSRFVAYEQQIQQEYAWVEPELYKQKRAEVLRHFYKMQPLYQTEYFMNLLENRAKLNLTNT